MSRESITSSLKLEEPQYGHRRFTLRNLLVIGQVAVAVVLLTAAGLFIRNLALTHTLDPGFAVDGRPSRRLTFPTSHGTEARRGWRRSTLRSSACRRCLECARGVRLGLPLTIHPGRSTGADLRVDGEGATFGANYQENYVSPGYFEAMGMRLLRGRDVAATDVAGAPKVAVINETFATRHFDGRDPVGLRLILPGPPNTTGIPTLVVGVVSDGKHRTIGEAQKAALYSPYAQNMGRAGAMTQLLVRTSTDAGNGASARPRRAGRARSVAGGRCADDESALAFAFLPSRVGAMLLGLSGALGLSLALVGLYAAVSFAVSRRTAEIGIRRALGATGGAVIRLVLGDWAWLVLTGIAMGLAGAWFITRPLAQFLVDGLSATDPVSFVARRCCWPR